MIDWFNIRALSFDCYGTLVDWETGVLNALRPLVQKHGEETVRALTAAVEPDIETAHPSWPYRHVLAEVYRQVARALGEPVDEDSAFAFSVSVGGWPPYPDTRAALARLARHFPLFLLTNVDEVSIAGTLAMLEAPFEQLFTAEECGAYKPDQRAFTHMVARLGKKGYAPEEIVHVAGSLSHEHAAARAAGMKTVWVNRQGTRTPSATSTHQREADHLRVHSLADLADFVEQSARSGRA